METQQPSDYAALLVAIAGHDLRQPLQAIQCIHEQHTRTKSQAVAIKQFQNSNAYAAPSNIAVQPDWSSLDGGAMTSGIAGH